MLKRLFESEPARLIGHSVTLLLAILTLLSTFGVALRPDQQDAIVNTVQATFLLLTIVVGAGTEAIRSNVYAPATVRKLVASTKREVRAENRSTSKR